MKALLLIAAFLTGCSTAGQVKPDGTILGPTSFLGEAIAKNFVATSSAGSMSVEAFATHNPERSLTKAIANTVIGLAAFKSADHINDNTTSTNNIQEASQGAALIKGTKDKNIIPK